MRNADDILIVGGGLNGAVLALALARAGLRATLVDATPPGIQEGADFDGRSYALARASQRMLAAIGLWDALAPDAQPILDIRVGDGRPGEGPGRATMHFDHAELEDGPLGFMVEDRHLRSAVLAAVAGSDRLQHRRGATVVAQDTGTGQAAVTLDDGETLHARLLVGADGRRSGVAERAGISRVGWRYGQDALVCAIAHERPHHGTAYQFFMPEGPLAILPLRGDRSSIVWTCPGDRAAGIAALDDAAFLAALQPRFGDFLGEIALAGQRHRYPLDVTLATRFVAPRVALVGDAAHGVHPIAGQGLNAGMRDVAALAQTLVEARRRGEDLGAADVLDRYQRWRRFDAAALAAATDGFNRLFSNDNPLLRAGRRLGMEAVSTIPGLRRAFIREAAGLTGDLPALLQGRPL